MVRKPLGVWGTDLRVKVTVPVYGIVLIASSLRRVEEHTQTSTLQQPLESCL